MLRPIVRACILLSFDRARAVVLAVEHACQHVGEMLELAPLQEIRLVGKFHARQSQALPLASSMLDCLD